MMPWNIFNWNSQKQKRPKQNKTDNNTNIPSVVYPKNNNPFNPFRDFDGQVLTNYLGESSRSLTSTSSGSVASLPGPKRDVIPIQNHGFGITSDDEKSLVRVEAGGNLEFNFDTVPEINAQINDEIDQQQINDNPPYNPNAPDLTQFSTFDKTEVRDISSNSINQASTRTVSNPTLPLSNPITNSLSHTNPLQPPTPRRASISRIHSSPMDTLSPPQSNSNQTNPTTMSRPKINIDMPKYNQQLSKLALRLFIQRFELWGNAKGLNCKEAKLTFPLAFSNPTAQSYFTIHYKDQLDPKINWSDFVAKIVATIPYDVDDPTSILEILQRKKPELEKSSLYVQRLRALMGDDFEKFPEPEIIRLMINSLEPNIVHYLECKGAPTTYSDLMTALKYYEERGLQTTLSQVNQNAWQSPLPQPQTFPLSSVTSQMNPQLVSSSPWQMQQTVPAQQQFPSIQQQQQQFMPHQNFQLQQTSIAHQQNQVQQQPNFQQQQAQFSQQQPTFTQQQIPSSQQQQSFSAQRFTNPIIPLQSSIYGVQNQASNDPNLGTQLASATAKPDATNQQLQEQINALTMAIQNIGQPNIGKQRQTYYCHICEKNTFHSTSRCYNNKRVFPDQDNQNNTSNNDQNVGRGRGRGRGRGGGRGRGRGGNQAFQNRNQNEEVEDADDESNQEN